MNDAPEAQAPMNECGTPLPRYKCHKTVEAFKITGIGPTQEAGATGGKLLIGDNIQWNVSSDYLLRHKPQIGGYFVRYEDGYESYSPAEPFEAGYKPVVDDDAGGPMIFDDGYRQVETLGEPTAGGAYAHYRIMTVAHPTRRLADIPLQHDTIPNVGVQGATNECLLAIVLDRLESFQDGAHPCEENAQAIVGIEMAQQQLLKRTKDREARGVEGQHKD